MTFFEQELLDQTAQKLNISRDEVKEALKIAGVYERHKRQQRTRRKVERARIRAEQELSELKQKHPEWCFCEADGFEATRDFENDRVIRTFTAYHYYDWRRENPYQEPVYECSRCGKEYTVEIAVA